jgi:hypothetical protein
MPVESPDADKSSSKSSADDTTGADLQQAGSSAAREGPRSACDGRVVGGRQQRPARTNKGDGRTQPAP